MENYNPQLKAIQAERDAMLKNFDMTETQTVAQRLEQLFKEIAIKGLGGENEPSDFAMAIVSRAQQPTNQL